MPYLLDADVIIQTLSARQQTLAAIERLAPEGFAVSLVTIGEIYEGAFRASNPYQHLHAIRTLLHPYQVVNLSDGIMERFAELRANLRRKGERIPDFDLVLCATALEHDLTLLTYNLRHMRRIPDLRVHSPH